MNIAIIFAGGVGSRFTMSDIPKQFKKIHGKEILIHTLEKFNNSKHINRIILVMNEDWLEHSMDLIKRFNLEKVKHVVSGGNTGQLSIYNGLKCAHENYPENSVVLIHDGVRPVVDDDLIYRNIQSVKKYGNAITVAPAIETVIALKDNKIKEVYDRSNCYHAKAPQSFILHDIYSSHIKALEENIDNFIDSANMMSYYNHQLHIVEGSNSNIKVTTDKDYYTLLAYLESDEDLGRLTDELRSITY